MISSLKFKQQSLVSRKSRPQFFDATFKIASLHTDPSLHSFTTAEKNLMSLRRLGMRRQFAWTSVIIVGLTALSGLSHFWNESTVKAAQSRYELTSE
jgi:hypothetical protein